MSYESFIALKILTGKSGQKRITNPVIRIAIAGIALGMAVMIVAVMVVTGFRKEITDKVIGFGSHIRISHFDTNSSYEETPVQTNKALLDKLRGIRGIRHVQVYATKAGIIKTDDEIQGIVLKGFAENYDTTFFRNKMVSGSLLRTGTGSSLNEVMISKQVASALLLNVGDDLLIYFIEQPPRIRKLKITGIYETGLHEFDQLYAFCDLRLIQKLNNWEEDEAGGVEMFVSDFNRLETTTDLVYHSAGFEFTTQNIKEQYPQIFHWLDLQNINVVIIIALILMVAGISMISTLLIIILENVTMIGIIKSLGATNYSVRKIFIYIAVPVIGLGIIAGNIIGLGLCYLQVQYGFLTLPQESYYVSKVPVDFTMLNLLLINAGTLIACVIMLIGPSMVVSRVLPSRVIRFD